MLDDLSDIVLVNALEYITIEEVNHEQGFMIGVDYNEIIRERKFAEREETALMRKERSNFEI